jgi:hypothetical protein
MDRVHIEILHTMGCPNWQAARSRVETLAAGDGIPVSVTETIVNTLAEAESHRFTGSPTILVEGRDVAPQAAPHAADPPADYGLG